VDLERMGNFESLRDRGLVKKDLASYETEIELYTA
jgi:hypothetical protein